MLLPPDRFQEEATILATLVRGERIDHFETERLTKDGRRIHISLSVSPIKDGTGHVIGGAKIARDISLRRQLEREREQALAQERHGRTLAEAANRAKDAFLAMVSHELRSPLSPILSWARMLRMKALDEGRVSCTGNDRAQRGRRHSSSTTCWISRASSRASCVTGGRAS
jgi:signal transduction histidine kinase